MPSKLPLGSDADRFIVSQLSLNGGGIWVLFPVGKVRITRAVLECDAIVVADLVDAFERFIQGDWGEIDIEKHLSNDIALTGGSKITAVYRSHRGQEFHITNESNATIIFLPETTQRRMDLVG